MSPEYEVYVEHMNLVLYMSAYSTLLSLLIMADKQVPLMFPKQSFHFELVNVRNNVESTVWLQSQRVAVLNRETYSSWSQSDSSNNRQSRWRKSERGMRSMRHSAVSPQQCLMTSCSLPQFSHGGIHIARHRACAEQPSWLIHVHYCTHIKKMSS